MTSDVLALVDFYVDNGIIEKDEEGNETYPVTALQIGTDPRVCGAFRIAGRVGGEGYWIMYTLNQQASLVMCALSHAYAIQCTFQELQYVVVLEHE